MSHTTYLKNALQPGFIAAAFKETTKGVKFDLLVGSGLSGTIPLAMLRERLGVNIGIVRKHTEDTHGMFGLEDTLPDLWLPEPVRWIFVDDFVAQGHTLERTKQSVKRYYPNAVLVGFFFYDEVAKFVPIIPGTIDERDYEHATIYTPHKDSEVPDFGTATGIARDATPWWRNRYTHSSE